MIKKGFIALALSAILTQSLQARSVVEDFLLLGLAITTYNVIVPENRRTVYYDNTVYYNTYQPSREVIIHNNYPTRTYYREYNSYPQREVIIYNNPPRHKYYNNSYRYNNYNSGYRTHSYNYSNGNHHHGNR